jgi:hypothetical protein
MAPNKQEVIMADKRTKKDLLKEIENLKADLKRTRNGSDTSFKEKLDLHNKLQYCKRLHETEKIYTERYREWGTIGRRRGDYNRELVEKHRATIHSLIKLIPHLVTICPECGKAEKYDNNGAAKKEKEDSHISILCSECHQDEPYGKIVYTIKNQVGSESKISLNYDVVVCDGPLGKVTFAKKTEHFRG